MKRKTSIFDRVRRAMEEMLAALLRIMVIFIFLLVGVDSVTRLYYSYMPIGTWIRFNSLSVQTNDEGVPTVYIDRETVEQAVTVFHRTLFILYPENSRACTASVVAVLDNPSSQTISLPLSRAVSATCPDVLKGRTIDAVLQVSYLIDFPFGVKRQAVRYSNRFSLTYTEQGYRIGPPLRNVGL